MKVPASVSQVFNRYRETGRIDAPPKELAEKTAGQVHDLAVFEFVVVKDADGKSDDLDGRQDHQVHLKDPAMGESHTRYQGDHENFTMTSETDTGDGGSIQMATNNPKTLTMLDIDWHEGGKATATAYEINKDDMGASKGYQMTWQLAGS